MGLCSRAPHIYSLSELFTFNVRTDFLERPQLLPRQLERLFKFLGLHLCNLHHHAVYRLRGKTPRHLPGKNHVAHHCNYWHFFDRNRHKNSKRKLHLGGKGEKISELCARAGDKKAQVGDRRQDVAKCPPC